MFICYKDTKEGRLKKNNKWVKPQFSAAWKDNYKLNNYEKYREIKNEKA